MEPFANKSHRKERQANPAVRTRRVNLGMPDAICGFIKKPNGPSEHEFEHKPMTPVTSIM